MIGREGASVNGEVPLVIEQRVHWIDAHASGRIQRHERWRRNACNNAALARLLINFNLLGTLIIAEELQERQGAELF